MRERRALFESPSLGDGNLDVRSRAPTCAIASFGAKSNSPDLAPLDDRGFSRPLDVRRLTSSAATQKSPESELRAHVDEKLNHR